MTPDEQALLAAALEDRQSVRIVVRGCDFSCCSRGWHRREYEQELVGRVAAHFEPDDDTDGLVLLNGDGISSIAYVARIRYREIEVVERP